MEDVLWSLVRDVAFMASSSLMLSPMLFWVDWHYWVISFICAGWLLGTIVGDFAKRSRELDQQ